MDDCSCGINAILDSRTVASSVWSPRSEGGVQEVIGYPGRLMLAPNATLPARHSKSLDQLGPDLVTSHQAQSIATSPKTLPRSASTQLISNKHQHQHHRSASRIATPPATVPSRGKQRPIAPSCTSLFPPQPRQQACSAPNPTLGEISVTRVVGNML